MIDTSDFIMSTFGKIEKFSLFKVTDILSQPFCHSVELSHQHKSNFPGGGKFGELEDKGYSSTQKQSTDFQK